MVYAKERIPYTLANLRRQVAESLSNLDGDMGLYQVGGVGQAQVQWYRSRGML